MTDFPPKPHPRFKSSVDQPPPDSESPFLKDLQEELKSLQKEIELNWGRLSYRNPEIKGTLSELATDLKKYRNKIHQQRKEGSGSSPFSPNSNKI